MQVTERPVADVQNPHDRPGCVYFVEYPVDSPTLTKEQTTNCSPRLCSLPCEWAAQWLILQTVKSIE